MDAVMDLQSAIVGGRLAHAREMASWLASHDMQLTLKQPRERELEYAATTVANAKDLPSAAAGVGRLGRACGSCHQAHGANASAMFVAMKIPDDDATIEAQMARHAWASRRLWEGVIAPSEVAWTDGARIMATTTIDLARTTNAKPNVEVVELAERLRGVATTAITAADHDARASLYGEMLATCASCHAITRSNPLSSGR
jgi:mono/diheme cytochrome c family protein